MEKTQKLPYTEKLAKLIFIAGILAAILFVGNYFSLVLGYICIAIVVSLFANPLMALLGKVKVKGKAAPEWFLALVSIIIILSVMTGLIAGLIPVVANVAGKISEIGSGAGMDIISTNMMAINEFLVTTFKLDRDFQLETALLEQVNSASDFSLVRNMLGSVASTTVHFFLGLFSVVFIAFFLIKDQKLLFKVLRSLSPDHLEKKAEESLSDVEYLLSRYFIGLFIEMSCVGLIDFLGLWLVASLDFESALGIAFFAALMNIIPYLGPVIGGIFGTSMGVVIKFAGVGPAAAGVSFWTFVLIVVCIFLASKLVDDFVFQPLIYSKSIQSHPLEIFLVLLLAGTIGGVVGMLVAIPAYTVMRVVAIKFFPDVKFIKALAGIGHKQ